MKKLKYISVALFISMMTISSSAVYAFPAQSIENIATHASVKATSGAITLVANSDEPIQFHIYSITGQAIKTITLSQGTTTIELPRGYYIVKCNYWSKTVIVK
ncbi:MAG: T9SS type A sorting domain-containing protein [Muribaculaceae bacterium]|nr:T9SS type A sorting domain-containing protein [Muribaculaceae bacterium]